MAVNDFLQKDLLGQADILIVEDDEGLSRQYRWAFPAYELFFADRREAACAIIGRERAAVAIIDLGLPPDPDGVSEGLALLPYRAALSAGVSAPKGTLT